MKLIVEMAMPSSCAKCPACDYEEADCLLADGRNTLPHNGARPVWCPIKGVLPDEHGDLIDRDALIEDINKQVRLLEAFGIEDLILIGKELQKGMIAEINKQTPVIAAERKDDEYN